tara:strand:+ start:32 stop:988 length:957 start_codon:yes stop_codon:yes gene_type:complete
MSYLGRSAKLSLKAQEKVSFLATAGQTSKTGLSYTPTFVEVYVNGVLLTDTTDFTATNGNSVTFTVALLLNDEVTVISLKTFTVADHYNKSDADTLLAAKAPIASPVFTGTVTADGLVVKSGSTTVGSIGTYGSYATIGAVNTGLRFTDAVDAIQPHSMSTNLPTSGVTDLGRSNSQFKDAYLSGGVYLGGTGAANKLDDYEEGTWTPTSGVGLTDAGGSYVKIGSLVMATFTFIVGTSASGSGFVIFGFPFSATSTGLQGQTITHGGSIGYTSSTKEMRIALQSSTLYFYDSGTSPYTFNDASGKIIRGTITYRTDS